MINKRIKLISKVQQIYNECINIIKHKNEDYATQYDPFKNFRLVEYLNLISVEKGILVRIADKLSRISNLLDKAPLCKEESIEDTIKDTINYLAILLSYIRLKK